MSIVTDEEVWKLKTSTSIEKDIENRHLIQQIGSSTRLSQYITITNMLLISFTYNITESQIL